MSKAMNQHKAMAEGKALTKSPSGVVKLKKGGAVKGNPLFGKMKKKGCK